MTSGIYLIKNNKTGQMYIGQSINIEKRWIAYTKYPDLKHSYIDKSIKKYSIENFSMYIIEECEDDKNILDKKEQYYIAKFNTFNDPKHCNLTPGGDFVPTMVPEIAKKVSEKMKGDKNHFYGKHHTKQSKEKISKAKKGTNCRKDNHFYGKKHTKESRRKMSQARRGRFLGNKNSNAVYNIWDCQYCCYDKNKMFRRKNQGESPRKCFRTKFRGYVLPIGNSYDFLTCEIIGKILGDICD